MSAQKRSACGLTQELYLYRLLRLGLWQMSSMFRLRRPVGSALGEELDAWRLKGLRPGFACCASKVLSILEISTYPVRTPRSDLAIPA